MFRIDERHYHQILSLLRQTKKTTPTNAWAIVERYIEGDVFSNETIHPKAALIGTKNGTYFICGKPDQQFIDAFVSFYEEKKDERFTIFSPNTMWDEIIEHVISGKTNKMKRKILSLNEQRFIEIGSSIRQSCEFEIHPITKDSLHKSTHFNEAYYKANWGSVEQFLKYGIGFYAVNNSNQIVSECTSIFMNSNKANIDIHTADEARGKGLALHLSKVFIEKCLQKGISPIWDCDCTNEPSFRLANKLGFEQLSEYHLYFR